jgi:hypothetical protein
MTVLTCYSTELRPGHSYVFRVSGIRIPVYIPSWAHGMYQTMTVQGHAVRFFAGVTPDCGSSTSAVSAGVLGGLVLVIAAILVSVFRHRRIPCDDPVHKPFNPPKRPRPL